MNTMIQPGFRGCFPFELYAGTDGAANHIFGLCDVRMLAGV
jgi:hypothetical protein